jgi:hypothetical protein
MLFKSTDFIIFILRHKNAVKQNEKSQKVDKQKFLKLEKKTSSFLAKGKAFYLQAVCRKEINFHWKNAYLSQQSFRENCFESFL